MAKLIYGMLCSLDGFIEDSGGKFDWAAPDAEVHQFFNDLVRSAGAFLYGRRMYETMSIWETDASFASHSAVAADFAQIWQAAEKIVYSRTLRSVATRRTRIEPTFDPEAVRQLKASSAGDLFIGGAELASTAFEAGLIDEVHLILSPISVGSGKRCLPTNLRLRLELEDERRFDSGMVYLRYRTQP